MQLMSTRSTSRTATAILFILCFTATFASCGDCQKDGCEESCACLHVCKCATIQSCTLEPDCTWMHFASDRQDHIARLLITDIFRPPNALA